MNIQLFLQPKTKKR